VTGTSPGGSLASTGPLEPILELTGVAGGLLLVGFALNRAGRKPRTARR
jgi:hypothetical protein